MIKNNILGKIFVGICLFFLGLNFVFADTPEVNCFGLPGCEQENVEEAFEWSLYENVGAELVTNIIGEIIQFVAVIAIISLIGSGIMYLLSGGEEEKVKKAKNWIIWSLVGVILSISAWGIINLLNEIQIG